MAEDWRRYPFELVPCDAQFRFPAAEGEHPGYESDTWFLAGEVTGERTGREYAFLTIFNKNRLGHNIVADFHTFALFDLDNGTYGTCTDYDVPPASTQPGAVPKMSITVGHLGIAYAGAAGTSQWRACRDGEQQLVPYTYEVALVGLDQAGEKMQLSLHVTPTRAPVPLGASAHHGKIACFGQDDTYSYFQTGMTMAGTLRWGGIEDTVAGDAGHVDRQWFPRYAAAGGPGGDPRSRSHEWRTITLDNGTDLSVWRQFDRTNHNALQPFSGATTSSDGAPECAEDIEVSIASYIRWPESIHTLIPPPAAARYLPDRHRLTSRQLDLDLTGEPLVPTPAHALPIDYMEGPYRYRGSMGGRPVTGFAFYERTLAMYRDWELVDVLATADAPMAAEVRRLIEANRRDEAIACLEKFDAPRPEVAQLVADLVTALT
ncbi:MAG: secreted hydrolase [Mycobacteriaceae bacterium]|nr:secreted hydrolase [Mycobacteriaceae bacterium]